MNAIDKAISYLWPSRGLARARAREMLRSYDAARTGQRQVGFGSSSGSANAAISPALRTLRNRARHLVRNTAHGSAIVDVMVRHTVGTGLTPIWNTGSDRLDRRVTLLWEEWSRRSDVEGETGFEEQQALAVRAMIEGGESLVRFVDLQYRDDPSLPMRLQLMEGDQIDGARDGVADGRRVRMGVGLGEWGRRTGYYLFPEHPGESMASMTSTFVERAQVQHLYRQLRIGQVRGVTWLAPILLPAQDLADLFQNTIVKTGIEASFSGFITNQGGGATPLASTVDPASGQRVTMPEPGMLVELKNGQDIKFAEPKTSTQFQAIALTTLQAMAVGAGLTYDQITGDLRQANYSSLRAGKIEHRRLVEQIQWHVIIPRLCNPVADRFIDRAILAGSLQRRAGGYAREWVTPANEPIDPKKDLEADILAVRAGRMSPQEFITQWGRDWRKVVADFGEFLAELDKSKVGLTFDIDPRKPRNGGPVPAAPSEGGAQEDDEADEEDDDDDQPDPAAAEAV